MPRLHCSCSLRPPVRFRESNNGVSQASAKPMLERAMSLDTAISTKGEGGRAGG